MIPTNYDLNFYLPFSRFWELLAGSILAYIELKHGRLKNTPLSHILPILGRAHVAYIPDGRVTGLSKLARVVEEVSRRPQVQERMTQTIADLVETRLGSRAVGVIVKSEHSCMSIRGIRKQGSLTVTSSMRGSFRTDPASRQELMSLISQGEKT